MNPVDSPLPLFNVEYARFSSRVCGRDNIEMGGGEKESKDVREWKKLWNRHSVSTIFARDCSARPASQPVYSTYVCIYLSVSFCLHYLHVFVSFFSWSVFLSMYFSLLSSHFVCILFVISVSCFLLFFHRALKKFDIICRPWVTIDGDINEGVLTMYEEAMLMYIVENPGIPQVANDLNVIT